MHQDDVLYPDPASEQRQLRLSLEALARPASDQFSLFREPSRTADALAVDFSNAAAAVTASGDGLSPSQDEALRAIERQLHAISRHAAEFDVDLWTDAALRSSGEWAEVRRLAARALDTFGWQPDDAPAAADER